MQSTVAFMYFYSTSIVNFLYITDKGEKNGILSRKTQVIQNVKNVIL